MFSFGTPGNSLGFSPLPQSAAGTSFVQTPAPINTSFGFGASPAPAQAASVPAPAPAQQSLFSFGMSQPAPTAAAAVALPAAAAAPVPAPLATGSIGAATAAAAAPLSQSALEEQRLQQYLAIPSRIRAVPLGYNNTTQLDESGPGLGFGRFKPAPGAASVPATAASNWGSLSAARIAAADALRTEPSRYGRGGAPAAATPAAVLANRAAAEAGGALSLAPRGGGGSSFRPGTTTLLPHAATSAALSMSGRPGSSMELDLADELAELARGGPARPAFFVQPRPQFVRTTSVPTSARDYSGALTAAHTLHPQRIPMDFGRTGGPSRLLPAQQPPLPRVNFSGAVATAATGTPALAASSWSMDAIAGAGTGLLDQQQQGQHQQHTGEDARDTRDGEHSVMLGDPSSPSHTHNGSYTGIYDAAADIEALNAPPSSTGRIGAIAATIMGSPAPHARVRWGATPASASTGGDATALDASLLHAAEHRATPAYRVSLRDGQRRSPYGSSSSSGTYTAGVHYLGQMTGDGEERHLPLPLRRDVEVARHLLHSLSPAEPLATAGAAAALQQSTALRSTSLLVAVQWPGVAPVCWVSVGEDTPHSSDATLHDVVLSARALLVDVLRGALSSSSNSAYELHTSSSSGSGCRSALAGTAPTADESAWLSASLAATSPDGLLPCIDGVVFPPTTSIEESGLLASAASASTAASGGRPSGAVVASLQLLSQLRPSAASSSRSEGALLQQQHEHSQYGDLVYGDVDDEGAAADDYARGADGGDGDGQFDDGQYYHAQQQQQRRQWDSAEGSVDADGAAAAANAYHGEEQGGYSAIMPSVFDGEAPLPSSQQRRRRRGHGGDNAASSSLAPSLGRLADKGYCTAPPLSELQTADEHALSCVVNFSVMRPGIGGIVWPGETDVRRLRLDAILRIQRDHSVTVYRNEGEESGAAAAGDGGEGSSEEDDPRRADSISISERGRQGSRSPHRPRTRLDERPPVGTGLNKRAVVTLEGVFNDEPAAWEVAGGINDSFVSRLKAHTAAIGARFVGYDAVTGSWSFAVPSF